MLNTVGAITADLYTPIAIIYSIMLLRKVYLSAQFLPTITSIFQSIVIVYTVMFADESLSIWPRIGLDYSTHTAIALVFVIHHCFSQAKYKMYSILLFILYLILMKGMGYHSVLDMLTTSIVITPILIVLWNWNKKGIQL